MYDKISNEYDTLITCRKPIYGAQYMNCRFQGRECNCSCGFRICDLLMEGWAWDLKCLKVYKG